MAMHRNDLSSLVILDTQRSVHNLHSSRFIFSILKFCERNFFAFHIEMLRRFGLL